MAWQCQPGVHPAYLHLHLADMLQNDLITDTLTSRGEKKRESIAVEST